MKSIIFIIKTLFISLLFITTNTFAKAGNTTDTVVIKTNIYCNHCLQCETCGVLLDKELRFTKGVKLATIDEKAMTITVKYNPDKTNPDKIRAAISKLGYDADHVKAESAGYDKLDGCCKKSE